MTVVLEARARWEQAQIDARDMIDLERARFGQIIKETRESGVTQDAIAKALGLTREQTRRYERYYEDYVAKHGEEPELD